MELENDTNRPIENIQNAGLVIMFCIWLQGQMVDLILLKKHPDLRADFVANPDIVPRQFSKQRAKYWEKQFGEVKSEFLGLFLTDLKTEDVEKLEQVFHVRNMIAHAHVSIGREYMLYRPAGEKKEKAVLEALKLRTVEDQSDPLMLTLRFWCPEVFKRISDMIEHLDQVCFRGLAETIGVPHGRIR